MTTTAPESPPADLAAIAEANARWLEAELLTGQRRSLQWLRFRPVRELEDGLAAARTARLLSAAEALTDAVRLAHGHKGGYSTPARGWTPIPYPVGPNDVVEVLGQAVTATNRLILPGGAYGWTWDRRVDTDPEARTVTITLRADHPNLA